MILVVGATGLLGTAICRRVRLRGHQGRALVRGDSPKATPLHELGLEIARGDLRDRPSLVAACRGASAVVTTANTVTSRRPGDTIASVDRDGHLALVEAARGAGASRFVHVSVSPTLPADNPFIGAKRDVERAVRASGMAWTILQPSAFMEIHCGPALGWDFAQGRARILGSATAPRSYISVDDVATFAVLALEAPTGVGRDLHVAGPEPLSAIDAVRTAERVTGRPFRVQRVPTAALRAMSLVLRPFSPVMSSLMAMGAATNRPEIVDMAAVVREFPVRLTTFEQYVRSAARTGE